MTTSEWPADDYAIGSYIQASIAEHYLKYLTLKPTDSVLDIGCGNGAFSRKIVERIPPGSFWGIDASQNMLQLAKDELVNYPNVTLQQADVLTMNFDEQFDYITSFWCLQWCAFAIESAFLKIYHSLKPGGKILTLFPVGDDPYITSYYALRRAGLYPFLNDFKPHVDYQNFHHLPERILALPF
ncbi:MAG: class I SAM-dependent methyltransferase [Legionella sp.]